MYPRTAIGHNEIFNGCVILFLCFRDLARTQPGCVTGNMCFTVIEANAGRRLSCPFSCHNVDPVGLVWFSLFSNQAGVILVIL